MAMAVKLLVLKLSQLRLLINGKTKIYLEKTVVRVSAVYAWLALPHRSTTLKLIFTSQWFVYSSYIGLTI